MQGRSREDSVGVAIISEAKRVWLKICWVKERSCICLLVYPHCLAMEPGLQT